MTDKICPRCDAVHHNLRWVFDRELRKKLEATQDVAKKLCPGCERVKRRQVDGVVTLKGKFFVEHKGEVMERVMRLVRARQRIAVEARVLNIDDRRSEVEIQTTDRHLAERIGKELENAFHGELSIKWPKKEEFVRVSWKRD